MDPDIGPSDSAPEDATPAATVAGSSGLPENVAGALCYAVGVITGVLFLIIDRERAYVRFHASQCLALFGAGVVLSILLMIVSTVLGVIPVVGFLVSMLISLALWIGGTLLWLFLMWQAWQGNEWEVPIVGPYARKLSAMVAGE